MYRVYVSSTYEDLKAWRARVIKAVRKLPDHHVVAMEDYPADDRYPLAKCLADVRESERYVGLIGWRAGFVPRGHDRAITELEYEEARLNGIPCLFFLAPERERPDPPADPEDFARVQRFRADVQREHMCKELTAESLGEDVMASLFAAALQRLHVPPNSGRNYSPLLPYTCDRGPQSNALTLQLASGRASTPAPASVTQEMPRSVPLCAIHGPPEQLPHKYRDWLQAGLFAQLTGLNGAEELAVSWPRGTSSDDDFAALLTVELAKAAHQPPTLERGELIARLHQRGDYYVSIELPLTGFNGAEAARVQAFIRYFRDWPSSPAIPIGRRPTGAPVVVLLWVRYLAEEKLGLMARLFGARSVNQQVRTLLEELGGNTGNARGPLNLFKPLADVTEDDALEWAQRREVRERSRQRDLPSAVAKIFRRHGTHALAMLTLAPELAKLLEDTTTEVEGP